MQIMIQPLVKDEIGLLQKVILGIGTSMGRVPHLKEAFDPKSYYSIFHNDFPDETDVEWELEQMRRTLEKYEVEVLRPTNIKNCNQVFARDITFVIEDKLFVSNVIHDRTEELEGFKEILDQIDTEKLVYLPEDVHAEGGDIIPWNNYIFVGTYRDYDYPFYKTARTNNAAVEFLQNYFPDKKVIAFDLNKNDSNPYRGILHLDCCFQPIGKGKCIIYSPGFLKQEQLTKIYKIFGKENLFEITSEELFDMNTNIFSISDDIIVSDIVFKRLNNKLRDWGFTVEEVPYREISKMGGLFRCTTMPLIRKYDK